MKFMVSASVSQHVGDDSHTPHVRRERDKLIIDDFWGQELRSTKVHLQLLPRLVSSGQPKVNDLNLVSCLIDTQYVLRLEVQVQDVMLMEVMDTLADLLGEQDHIQFSQVVLLFCDPVKELTAIHVLHDEGKAVLALKGVVELDQVHMAELVHDVNLILDILPVLGALHFDDLGRQ